VLLVYGVRKKYPLSTWLTVVAWLMVFFIMGLKLMNFPLAEWGRILFTAGDEPVYLKFVPGGVLFFVIGLGLIRGMLNFRAPVTDGLILAVPLILAVQRVGCFINGCCYGKPTGLPWAVHYEPGTSAYNHYLASGLVQPGDAVSCGIHPAQLYTLAGALLVFLILFRFRDTWKSPGGRALFGIILLMALRFTMEFFRESDFGKWYAPGFLGLNALQWIILTVAAACTTMLVIRERRPRPEAAAVIPAEIPIRNAAALLVLMLLIWNGSRLFEFSELVLVCTLLLAAVAVNLVRYFSAAMPPVYRYAAPAILLIAFTTMSQQVIREETDSISKSRGNFWVSAGLRGSGGRYDEVTRDCDGTETGRMHKGQLAASADVTLHYRPSDTHQFDYGLNTWLYRNKFLDANLDNYLNWGVAPFIRYNLTTRQHNWLEIMAGVNYSPTDSLVSSSHWFPNFYLRLGPKDVFFADAGFSNDMLMTGKPNVLQFGLGTGLRNLPGSTLRFGMSLGPETNWLFGSNMTDDDGFHLYLAGDFPLKNGLTLKPGIYVINKAFATLGLRYNFGGPGK
jgi:phosphatidylglycerol:prolipoprotein diacylglycerol transferase